MDHSDLSRSRGCHLLGFAWVLVLMRLQLYPVTSFLCAMELTLFVLVALLDRSQHNENPDGVQHYGSALPSSDKRSYIGKCKMFRGSKKPFCLISLLKQLREEK